MSQGLIISIMQSAVMVVLKCSLPMLLVALLIGVIISIIQAATQIHEQTLSFGPKIAATFLALVASLGYIINEVVAFANQIFAYMSQVG